MSKKSISPRKDIIVPEPSWKSAREQFPVSQDKWDQIQKKARVILTEMTRDNLLYVLARFCSELECAKDAPSVKDVQAKIEIWRRLSDELSKAMINDGSSEWKSATRRINNFFFDDIEKEKLWVDARGYLQEQSEIKRQLASFCEGCKGALDRLNDEITRDQGGVSGDINRSELLRAIERLFLRSGGKSIYQDTYTSDVIALLPEDKRPSLPVGKGEIKKLIQRYNARYVKDIG